MRIVLSILGGYALVALALFIFQEKMLFHPQVARNFEPKQFPTNIEKIYLDVAPNIKLQGVKSKEVTKDAPILFAFGGNAHNITAFISYMADLLPHVNVMAFNYRGFGESEGRPKAADILADAKYIHKWLCAEYPDAPVYLMGVSMGTGPATLLASANKAKGLILAMPYDDLADLGVEKYPWLPVQHLFRNHMKPLDWAPKVKIPTAIVVAGNDQLIKNERSRRLADALPNVIDYHTLSGVGHVELLSDPRLNTWLPQAFQKLHTFKNTHKTAE